MDKLLIRGGRRLQGELPIAGAKNAALPERTAARRTEQHVKGIAADLRARDADIERVAA